MSQDIRIDSLIAFYFPLEVEDHLLLHSFDCFADCVENGSWSVVRLVTRVSFQFFRISSNFMRRVPFGKDRLASLETDRLRTCETRFSRSFFFHYSSYITLHQSQSVVVFISYFPLSVNWPFCRPHHNNGFPFTRLFLHRPYLLISVSILDQLAQSLQFNSLGDASSEKNPEWVTTNWSWKLTGRKSSGLELDSSLITFSL